MKEEIGRKLEHLRGYVQELKDLQGRNLQKVERAAQERFLQLAIESVIDICSVIISHEGYERPDEYRKAIRTLGEHGILDRAFAEKFSAVAGLRNILVHRYAEIRQDMLEENLSAHLQDFDSFARQVAAYLTPR